MTIEELIVVLRSQPDPKQKVVVRRGEWGFIDPGDDDLKQTVVRESKVTPGRYSEEFYPQVPDDEDDAPKQTVFVI